MENEIIENYNKSEKISTEVMTLAKSMLKENEKIFDIAESVEKKIIELGGSLAFPFNISINENAAHYTPDVNDVIVLKQGDLVKIDFGVHSDGYIWDRAFTACIGSKTHPLIKVSEKALKEALKIIKPGVKVCEVSEVVEDVIAAEGFNPVRNLCGHGLEQYNQHADPTIPNGKNRIQTVIEENQAIAMEVFATNGAGLVKESSPTLIFKFHQNRPVRMTEARKILEYSQTKFEGLPFAKRWLKEITSPVKIDMALSQLISADALVEYPILKEETNGLVAQTEETVILQ